MANMQKTSIMVSRELDYYYTRKVQTSAKQLISREVAQHSRLLHDQRSPLEDQGSN